MTIEGGVKLRKPVWPSAEQVEALDLEYGWLDMMAARWPGGAEDFWRRHREYVDGACRKGRLRSLRLRWYQGDFPGENL